MVNQMMLLGGASVPTSTSTLPLTQYQRSPWTIPSAIFDAEAMRATRTLGTTLLLLRVLILEYLTDRKLTPSSIA
jgi:hypothetical protein